MERTSILDLEHQIIVTKSALSHTRKKIEEGKQHLTMMDKKEKDLVASMHWHESELNARYNDPKGLNSVVQSLSKCCSSLLHLATTKVVKARSNQVEQRDRNHVPIHDMYDYCSSEEERNHFIELENDAQTNEELDDDEDVAYPFELSTGLTMLRWINYTLRKVTGASDGAGGGGAFLNMLDNDELYIKSYTQLQTKHLYNICLRTMPNELARVTRQHKETLLNNTSGEAKKKKKMKLEQHPSFHLGQLILNAGKINWERAGLPKLGQFLNVDQIVPDHEQEQIEEDILQQKQHSKKSSPSKNSPSRNSPKNSRKKRSKRESSDIQRVMYKGQMIDVEDPSEQLIFAFMCQIAMARPCVDEVEIVPSSSNSSNNNSNSGSSPLELLMLKQEQDDEENSFDDNEKTARHQAASKIQAIHQGRKARKFSLYEHKKRNLAATRIQASHRGRETRKAKKRIKLSEDLEPSKVDASMAYDEIHATRVGLNNVLRDMIENGVLTSSSEAILEIHQKIEKYTRISLLSYIIFDKWSVTEDSFLSWREVMDSGQKLSWRSVCQLTMAQKNIIEERNDDGSFTKISKRRVKDLFIEVSSIQSKEDGKQQVDDVELILQEHLGLTMKLFAHYAGDAGSSSTMNRSEFNRFIKEAGIKRSSKSSSSSSKNDLTSASIDLIFARVNAPVLGISPMVKMKAKAKRAKDNLQHNSKNQHTSTANDLDLTLSVDLDVDLEEHEDDDEEDDYEADENDKEMVPQEFVEALLRLSVAKYHRKKSMTMAARLEKIIEDYMIPLSAVVSDNISFRAEMTHELVQLVLKKKRKRLKLFFLFYSAKDDSDDAVKHSTTMNINECIQLCREMHLNVPDRVISRLFACVQGDEDDDDDETSMLEEKGELTYTEFAEFMSAVASWNAPNPYVPLAKKLDIFLTETLKKHEDVNQISITANKRLRKNSIG